VYPNLKLTIKTQQTVVMAITRIMLMAMKIMRKKIQRLISTRRMINRAMMTIAVQTKKKTLSRSK
jgi:hypothetical protein